MAGAGERLKIKGHGAVTMCTTWVNWRALLKGISTRVADWSCTNLFNAVSRSTTHTCSWTGTFKEVGTLSVGIKGVECGRACAQQNWRSNRSGTHAICVLVNSTTVSWLLAAKIIRECSVVHAVITAIVVDTVVGPTNGWGQDAFVFIDT
jgi:hypothetical protein